MRVECDKIEMVVLGSFSEIVGVGNDFYGQAA